VSIVNILPGRMGGARRPTKGKKKKNGPGNFMGNRFPRFFRLIFFSPLTLRGALEVRSSETWDYGHGGPPTSGLPKRFLQPTGHCDLGGDSFGGDLGFIALSFPQKPPVQFQCHSPNTDGIPRGGSWGRGFHEDCFRLGPFNAPLVFV